MPHHHQYAICKSTRNRPVTLISTIQDPNGQMRQTVLGGPKPTLSPYFEEEGIYILYKNRALQIAAAPCDQRRCNMTCVCTCAAVGSKINLTSNNQSQHIPNPPKGCTTECMASWLHLYEAVEQTRSLEFCFLAHPRSLTWDDSLDDTTFTYDSEVEDLYTATKTWRYTWSCTKKSRRDPCKVMLRIQESWKQFLEAGGHRMPAVVALTDEPVDESWDTLEEWDDSDVPLLEVDCEEQEDEFDTIEDLIEEEFPKLRSRSAAPKSCDTTKRRMSTTSTKSEDMPAPVITPPKNIAIGRLKSFPMSDSYVMSRDARRYKEVKESWIEKNIGYLRAGELAS
ncbi:hypothetical protein GGR57DRAFT_510096 [Xylariaceae sp. FL1272]|nr:hypothetical protein GGR57DRAFT_510096 [Xylariaceae sp. FL1272]